jgi:hypothetical protein
LPAENRVIEEEQRTLVERLLREKISLHGICRAVGVSIRWLMDFMVARFQAAPEDLHVQLPGRPGEVIIRRVEAEADEMHSSDPERLRSMTNFPYMQVGLDQGVGRLMPPDLAHSSSGRTEGRWR